MLAGVFDGVGHVSVQRVPLPSLAGHMPGTVLIRGWHATICGSDLLYIKQPRMHIDACHGCSIHEVVGEVVDVVGNSAFAKGTMVLALPTNYMASGIYRGVDTALAADLKSLTVVGGLAQYFLSHTSHIFALPDPLPPGIPLSHFAAAQALGTIVWMMKKAPNMVCKNVVVVGQGPNGLMATHLAALACAKSVIGIDYFDNRLACAKEMGATHVLKFEGDANATAEQLRALTQGKGADLVFEMVGHQQATISECFEYAAESGTVIAFGVPHQPQYELDYGKFFRKNLTLVGSVFPATNEDFALAVDLITQQRVRLAPLFTHSFPITKADTAFDTCLNSKHAIVKAVIDLQEEAP